jgi:hypothetical protein
MAEPGPLVDSACRNSDPGLLIVQTVAGTSLSMYQQQARARSDHSEGLLVWLLPALHDDLDHLNAAVASRARLEAHEADHSGHDMGGGDGHRRGDSHHVGLLRAYHQLREETVVSYLGLSAVLDHV